MTLKGIFLLNPLILFHYFEATRQNLPGSRRRQNVGINQNVTRSAPQASSSAAAVGSQPVSLTMTVAHNERGDLRQFSAGSNISRLAEEEKVEQLKHMNLVSNIAFSKTVSCNP